LTHEGKADWTDEARVRDFRPLSVKTRGKRKATPPRKGWANANYYYKLNPRKDNRDLNATGTNHGSLLVAVARIRYEKANRKSQAVFLCKHCGFSADVDWNAARNIRALAVLCNAAIELAIVEAKTGNGTAAEISRKATAL
jgi:Putative transposase DNA-binding domain